MFSNAKFYKLSTQPLKHFDRKPSYKCLKTFENMSRRMQWYRHEGEKSNKEANHEAEKWSIDTEFSKFRHRKVNPHFYKLCEDPGTLFNVEIFFGLLDISINQLKSLNSLMNEIVSSFSDF